MFLIEIKTIGEVSFDKQNRNPHGFKYDVPFDNFGLPSIPLFEEINNKYPLPDGVKISFATNEGYPGLMTMLGLLVENVRGVTPFIRNNYTNTRFYPEKGYKTRSIKAGLVFVAYIQFPEEEKENIRNILNSITQIGVCDGEITGRVSVSFREFTRSKRRYPLVNDLCNYTSLDYSVRLLTPTCIAAPYNDGAKTEMFIPGETIRNYLKMDNIICSHAYPSSKRERLMPVPLCASLVKLDKKQLRYRLSPGKNPDLVEQDVVIKNSFTENIRKHTVRFTSVETEKIVTSDGVGKDFLMPGLVFSGTIYGCKSDLLEVVNRFEDQFLGFIGGAETNEGFGEVLFSVDRLNEDAVPEQRLASCFDLVCLSETMIINDDGMYTCDAEDLLKEIERVLGVSDVLRIAGKYTDAFYDYRTNQKWGCDGAVTRCFAIGSVLRIVTKDGSAIDIAGILHTFVGERNIDGYGEIMVYPAGNEYYRLAERFTPIDYSAIAIEDRDIMIGASAVNSVLRIMIEAKVKALAEIDREEYQSGIPAEKLVPLELLSFLKARFASCVDDDTLKQWYIQGLEEKVDG